jgi:hypothetical protein
MLHLHRYDGMSLLEDGRNLGPVVDQIIRDTLNLVANILVVTHIHDVIVRADDHLNSLKL